MSDVAERTKLKFDTENDPIKSDLAWGCVIYADHPERGRLCFAIDTAILYLLGGDVPHNPVHHEQNEALCEANRPEIEAACRHALLENRTELLARDFR